LTLHLRRAAAPEVPWSELDGRADRIVTQTLAWQDFLLETQQISPVAARVIDGDDTVGWFVAGIVRRGPIRVLGSPMRGWTTAGMGFNLDRGIDRTEALAALPSFAFDDLGCVHVEFADRSLTDDADVPEGFHIDHLRGYELSLVVDGSPASDDSLLAGMTAHGRRDVRRGIRNGIEVELVDPLAPGTFAEEYYAQVSEAFAKRGKVPTYPVGRVDALIRHLGPTGRLLLLRAHTATGEVAATGIFPGLAGSTAEFWMGASVRAHQHLLPNEVLMWTALRAWRDRGAVRFNFGGGGSYKAKYGGMPHTMPWVRRSRFEAVEAARQRAFELNRWRQRHTRG